MFVSPSLLTIRSLQLGLYTVLHFKSCSTPLIRLKWVCPSCLSGHAESSKLFHRRENAGCGIFVYSLYRPRNERSSFRARCLLVLLLSHKIEVQISHSSENIKKMSSTGTISDVSRMDAVAGLLAYHTSVNLCVNEVLRPS